MLHPFRKGFEGGRVLAGQGNFELCVELSWRMGITYRNEAWVLGLLLG